MLIERVRRSLAARASLGVDKLHSALYTLRVFMWARGDIAAQGIPFHATLTENPSARPRDDACKPLKKHCSVIESKQMRLHLYF